MIGEAAHVEDIEEALVMVWFTPNHSIWPDHWLFDPTIEFVVAASVAVFRFFEYKLAEFVHKLILARLQKPE